MTLLEQIQKEHAAAFTHGGKFHADDVFSAALLLHFNPQLTIQRGNRVPEDFAGIVFDIGRGEYDHHQKDAGSGKTRFRTRRLAFYGRHLAQKF